jgi:hypothetical protein
MSQRRRIVGGSDGYTIMLAEELDADDNPIAAWFEVYSPDGEWLSSFPREEIALAFVESQVEYVSTFRPK